MTAHMHAEVMHVCSLTSKQATKTRYSIQSESLSHPTKAQVSETSHLILLIVMKLRCHATGKLHTLLEIRCKHEVTATDEGALLSIDNSQLSKLPLKVTQARQDLTGRRLFKFF